MRYLKTFESFRLVLEKTKKDQDYYSAREEFYPFADSMKSELEKLNKKIIRENVDFYEKMKGWEPNKIKEIRSGVVKILFNTLSAMKEEIYTPIDLPEGLEKTLEKMVKDKTYADYFDAQSGFVRQVNKENGIYILKSPESKSEPLFIRLKKIEVEFRPFKEMLTIDTESIERNYLIEILDTMCEWINKEVAPEDPKKLEIKKDLKSGMDPKKVAKKYKLNPEELKELIAQAQGQIESEEIQSAKEDLSKLKEKPKLDLSPEDKKINDVEEMIEEFREFGKEFFKSNSTSRVEFQIQVDKFKLFLQKKGYEIPIRGDFKQTISTLMIDELKNPNSIYKQFLEMPEFMNVSIQSTSEKIEKYRIKGIIRINGNNLSIEKTSNSRLGIWKDSDGNAIYDKAEREKRGMKNNDKCEIKALFPSAPIGKDKIKLGKKSIKSGSLVTVTGFGLSPLIVVSEDDINFA